MGNINVSSMNKQPEGNWKISYNVAFKDSSYVSGFIFLDDDVYVNLNLSQLIAKIKAVNVANFSDDAKDAD